jgi:molecular chaperone DnaK
MLIFIWKSNDFCFLRKIRRGCHKGANMSEKHEKITGKVYGIDLGTTNSCIAVLEGGKPHVISNLEGIRTTPSFISYQSKDHRVVGNAAIRRAVTDPTNTIYRSKSFIGLTYDEAMKQVHKHPMPFDLVKSKSGGVDFKLGVGVQLSPSEVGAAILQELVKAAEKYAGHPVKNVVITVPAYFNDAQRQATKDAGAIAGLNVVRIINEPTAAALAYGLEKIKHDTKIAVYDLGGGTFDVSILEVSADGVFRVISTNGDTHLGGEDFDQKLVHYICDEFKKESGIDLLKNNDKAALQRLREAAEKAKINLSFQPTTEVNLPFITADASGPKHLNVTISKAKFEDLIANDLKKTEECCKKALHDAKLAIKEINKVLLVGGSTRIPAVQSLVEKIFGQKPSCDINPDEAVAIGAAAQGGILSGDITDVLLLDVIPLSLGIETLGGVMTKLIERNTTIPVQKQQIFSTASDNQTSVSIRVFQGERDMAEGNKLLGEFNLHGIPPAPRGIPQVEVSFNVDQNGILKVSAKEKNTGKEQTITIQGSSGLSKEDIAKATKDAEDHKEADKDRLELITLKNNADNLVYTAEKALKETKNLSDQLKGDVEVKIHALKEKLSHHDKGAIQSAYDDLSSEMGKVYEAASKETQNNQQQDQNNQSQEESQV